LDLTPGITVLGVTMTAPETGLMSVGQLAARVGVRSDTIRYYERAGLLPPPTRTAADHRRYGEAAIDRLHFIQGAQRLGLRLRDIGDLLSVRDTGNCPCEPAEQLLRRRITEVDAELSRLTALRADLERMADALPRADCPDPEPGKWCPPEMRGVTNGERV
jgi:DNA-binding transcriptional MerR regulator